MQQGGDAAEQLIRVTLSGAETVLRLTGAGVKELALFIAAALKNPQKSKEKLKGEARLREMLRCPNPTEIFSIREAELETFVNAAKKYGIRYCVAKNPKDCPDNLCDLMTKAEDAPKIRRIAERYGFATLDRATVEHERERAAPKISDPKLPNLEIADDLADDLMGKSESARSESGLPFAPSSEIERKSSEEIFDRDERKSVSKELEEIKEKRKKKKPQKQQKIKHKQPKKKRKRRKSR